MTSNYNRGVASGNSDSLSTASTLVTPVTDGKFNKPYATGSNSSARKESGRANPGEKGKDKAPTHIIDSLKSKSVGGYEVPEIPSCMKPPTPVRQAPKPVRKHLPTRQTAYGLPSSSWASPPLEAHRPGYEQSYSPQSQTGKIPAGVQRILVPYYPPTIPEEPPDDVPLRGASSTRHVESKAQGLWNGSTNTDLTLHLELEVVEDLDTLLEEFSRLCMLGCFTACKQFVRDNLANHLFLPYVRIQLAEMMLRQGDYTSMVDLGYQNPPHQPADEHQRLLDDYLALMTLLAENHDPKTGRFAYHGIMSQVLEDLSRRSQSDEMGSTETNMLATALRLSIESCHEASRHQLNQKINHMFPPKFWRSLYSDMLRNGRVWDLSEPFLAIGFVNGITEVFSNIFEEQSLSEAVGKLVSQWLETAPSDDVLTVSALLDFLMSLLTEYLYWDNGADSIIEGILHHSTPLAHALVQYDQGLLRTRPYLQWVLATARRAHEKASTDVESFVQYLERQGGDTSYTDRRSLPQYIPLDQENPGWQLPKAAPQFQDPVRLALKMARDLGDYKTEVIALQQLILLLENPTKEFAELCEVQRSTGDLVGYVNTLISKYLVSDTEESKHELQEALSDEILIDGVADVLDEDLVWKAHELLQSLRTSRIRARLGHRTSRGAGKSMSAVLPAARNRFPREDGSFIKRSTMATTPNNALGRNRVRVLPTDSLSAISTRDKPIRTRSSGTSLSDSELESWSDSSYHSGVPQKTIPGPARREVFPKAKSITKPNSMGAWPFPVDEEDGTQDADPGGETGSVSKALERRTSGSEKVAKQDTHLPRTAEQPPQARSPPTSLPVPSYMEHPSSSGSGVESNRGLRSLVSYGRTDNGEQQRHEENRHGKNPDRTPVSPRHLNQGTGHNEQRVDSNLKPAEHVPQPVAVPESAPGPSGTGNKNSGELPGDSGVGERAFILS
ncbi:hypothetical protein PG985_001678 [Apiospora marii]|uniref:uncharacterized protein n=1 Tax=Apiospora marii TaxID=335849 RepID=UPI0031321AB1